MSDDNDDGQTYGLSHMAEVVALAALFRADAMRLAAELRDHVPWQTHTGCSKCAVLAAHDVIVTASGGDPLDVWALAEMARLEVANQVDDGEHDEHHHQDADDT